MNDETEKSHKFLSPLSQGIIPVWNRTKLVPKPMKALFLFGIIQNLCHKTMQKQQRIPPSTKNISGL